MNSMFPGTSGTKKKRSVLALLCAAVIILLAAVGVLFWKYQEAKDMTANQSQETSNRVIQKVSNLYLVPTNEEPTVAQIQDKSKLGNQEFFKTSQNGDYLLVYQKAKLAIVYRENDNKLVNVGPVSIGDESTTDTQTAEQNQDQTQEGQTAGAQTEPTTEAPAE